MDHILVAECGVQVRRLLPTFMQFHVVVTFSTRYATYLNLARNSTPSAWHKLDAQVLSKSCASVLRERVARRPSHHDQTLSCKWMKVRACFGGNFKSCRQ